MSALPVRVGGHDWVGPALCDGVAMDLSGMRRVAICSDGTARMSGGRGFVSRGEE
jgi:hypothetical protein